MIKTLPTIALGLLILYILGLAGASDFSSLYPNRELLVTTKEN